MQGLCQKWWVSVLHAGHLVTVIRQLYDFYLGRIWWLERVQHFSICMFLVTFLLITIVCVLEPNSTTHKKHDVELTTIMGFHTFSTYNGTVSQNMANVDLFLPPPSKFTIDTRRTTGPEQTHYCFAPRPRMCGWWFGVIRSKGIYLFISVCPAPSVSPGIYCVNTCLIYFLHFQTRDTKRDTFVLSSDLTRWFSKNWVTNLPTNAGNRQYWHIFKYRKKWHPHCGHC